MTPDHGKQAEPRRQDQFNTTHWSVVLAARGDDTTCVHAALSTLCQAYWYPLYAHVRRRGHDAENARDLTQGFFAQLLARNAVELADPQRGRFRTFLLAALDNFLHHAHRDAQALKRGGGKETVSLDAQDAEQRFALEPADERSPDREFDRRWALATLERARGRLRHEFALAGKAELFDLLRPHLQGDADGPAYAPIAAQLNLTVGAVKVTVHRLRRRYGELLREEVAQTLANPADAEAEIRHLIASLS
ncbi:MAG: sigma-70 family RNA polymerase sigma factor [Verrucomicrobia bacterium]|nr:sigma-70 family RNA polymerase sigma factor [Verrucomicrobiota bacterium]